MTAEAPSASRRLTLLCHASTAATTKTRFPADEPLEDRGRARAAAAAPALAGTDRLWCGPTRRCRETAAALGRDAVVVPALDDWDVGRWRGLALDDVEAAEPEAVMAWLTDPAANPHGGESVEDLLARVGRWLDGLGAESPRVVAVTHAAVIRAAVVHALGARPESFWRIDVPPLSRTELRGRDGRWTLRSTRCSL